MTIKANVSVRRAGDNFTIFNQAVIAYRSRGLTRAEAIRHAAIDYPRLHQEWKTDNAAHHTQSRMSRQSRCGW